MLTHSEAFDMVRNHVLKKNIVYHMIAVEAIMRELARYFAEDEKTWGLTGLLHDVDYERTQATPERHGLLAEDMLKGHVNEDVTKAIKAHNFEQTGVTPGTRMEKGLMAADAVLGLLIACALVTPSKRLVDVRVESVTKKFKDKDFAKGAVRERILFCEQIGIPRYRFFDIALNGLKRSASEIGL